MITRLAPAKINLYLHVHGKRADGFHLLDSLVGFADIGDEMTVREAESLSLSIHGPFAQSLEQEDNLVLRAAVLLREHFKIEMGADIQLNKQLPIAAGVGGGSADAAAALHALCELWSIEIPLHELQVLSEPLGSDVPVCVYGQSAFMSGTGHVLDPAPSFPALPSILVNPNVALPTPDVYAALSMPQTVASRPEFDMASRAEFVAGISSCRNDLQEAAIACQPIVASVLEALEASEGCDIARLCGSGATCFGVFANEAIRDAACKDLQAQHPDWWVRPTHIQG